MNKKLLLRILLWVIGITITVLFNIYFIAIEQCGYIFYPIIILFGLCIGFLIGIIENYFNLS